MSDDPLAQWGEDEEGQFYMYDVIDMKSSYRSGWWTGFAVGALVVFILCLAAGLYLPA